jgi:sulfite reductase beta subunit-like hemoprotein
MQWLIWLTVTVLVNCVPRMSRTSCLADVQQSIALPDLWQELKTLGFDTANIGYLTNIIACPGGDFCSLANAKSLPIAEAIQRRFDDLDVRSTTLASWT